MFNILVPICPIFFNKWYSLNQIVPISAEEKEIMNDITTLKDK